jgi:CHAT domain-containing protein
LDATCGKLEETLRSLGRVHILHFCGHGQHNSDNPENSGLLLVTEKGECDFVSSRKLLHIFEEAQIWFLYMSCCYSGAISDAPTRGGISGVVHAAVDAKIPNILSYRWQVSDEGAQEFACNFYRKLLNGSPCSLSEATIACRRKADGSQISSDAWASPILITNSS